MSPRRCSDDWSDRVNVEAFFIYYLLVDLLTYLFGGAEKGLAGGGGDLPLTSDRRLEGKSEVDSGSDPGIP